MPTAAMTDPTIPACLRCRGQKLKCSRDQPKCSRCRRLNTECTYVQRQTCKHSANNSVSPQKRRKLNTSSPATDLDRATSSLFDDATISFEETRYAADEFATAEQQEALIDLYFDGTFNSSLVFHRPTFMRQFRVKLLSRAVCLAVCAMGTIFLHSSSCTPQVKELFANMEDMEGKARKWAIQAGTEVLQQMDEPTIERLQTCQVLGIYWFSRDEPQRNSLFSGIAYRAMRTLVVSRDDKAVSADSMTSEVIARMFWATWTQECINADHYIVGSSLDSQLMQIELPASHKSFHAGIAESQGTLGDDTLSSSGTPGSSELPNASVMAESMKLVLLWAQIRDHLEMRSRLPIKSWAEHLSTFEARLENWSSDLPKSLRYSKRALFEQLVSNQESMYFAMIAIYHQCRINLHASLVPRLSGSKSHDELPLEVVQASARSAIESARHLSALARDLLALDWDVSQTAPFVGYSMYTSCVIHMTLLDSSLTGIGPSARADLFSSLRILKAMKGTWKHLERLWARALVLFQVRMQAISQHRLAVTGTTASTFGTTDELQQADKRREDANDLPEALSQSLLHHSLQKVRMNISVNETPDLANQLNEDITFEQIQSIIEDMQPTAKFSPEDSWLETHQNNATAYVNDLRLDEFTTSTLQNDFVLDDLWGQDMTGHSMGLTYLNDVIPFA